VPLTHRNLLEHTALKIVQAFAPLQAFLWLFAGKNSNFL